MKCPLTLIESYHDGQEFQPIHADCLKEECACWQPGDEQCAILNLAEGVADVAHWLGEIVAKMPYKPEL